MLGVDLFNSNPDFDFIFVELCVKTNRIATYIRLKMGFALFVI